MIKVIALINRRSDLTLGQFLTHWESEHAPYIRRLPGIRRYRQNHAIEHRSQWPYDGAAEVWFDSVGDVARAFESPAADAMRKDEKNFIGAMTWFIAEEHEISLEEGVRA